MSALVQVTWQRLQRILISEDHRRHRRRHRRHRGRHRPRRLPNPHPHPHPRHRHPHPAQVGVFGLHVFEQLKNQEIWNGTLGAGSQGYFQNNPGMPGQMILIQLISVGFLLFSHCFFMARPQTLFFMFSKIKDFGKML